MDVRTGCVSPTIPLPQTPTPPPLFSPKPLIFSNLARWCSLPDRRTVLLGCALALVLFAGVVFRLLWVEDMEYKADEIWTFEMTQQAGRTSAVPLLGMPTSQEIRHPGGTVWVFLLLARLTGAEHPTELARATQGLNIAALLLLLVFVLRCVPAVEREAWWWGLALVAVNPLAVLLHRKIWPPSITPFFSMLLLLGWWYRGRRWGALAWGFAGALLAQVHPAGMFMVAGFAGWALLFRRREVWWRWWVTGSALASVGLIPWLLYLREEFAHRTMHKSQLVHLFEFKFWSRWATEPFGISLHYTLGADFVDFLQAPVVAGTPTYLVAGLHALLLLAMGAIVGRGLVGLWHARRAWAALFAGRGSATAFTQNASLWGFGLVFSATLLPIHRHYMVLTFPLMFVWVARLALGGDETSASRTGRCWLGVLCAVQLLLTGAFLSYVHGLERPVQGEYGTPYALQRRLSSSP